MLILKKHYQFVKFYFITSSKLVKFILLLDNVDGIVYKNYLHSYKMNTENNINEKSKEYSVITRIDHELFELFENARFKDQRTRSSAVRIAIKEYCQKL